MTQDPGKRSGSHRSETFSSNAVRLSVREWVLVLTFMALIAFLIEPLWQELERFQPAEDYRVPYGLTEDYWLFERFCESMMEQKRTMVFGDSFIWGQYVEKDGSLTHFLNRHAGEERFINAGLDGAHPLALSGLIRHHCPGLEGADVVLHLNLLWLSSPQADLQAERELAFNHPRLVPQFHPDVPSYGESVSGRIGVVLARYVPFLQWVGHLQEAYFGSGDLVRWTLDHPYQNPLGQVTLKLPGSEDNIHPGAQAWSARAQGDQDLPWVALDSSLQWQAFQGLLEDFRSRGTRVLVVVGPLNEHMLSPLNRDVYRGIVEEVGAWMDESQVPHVISSTLPSELYADLSHPFSQGYALMADELWGQIQGR